MPSLPRRHMLAAALSAVVLTAPAAAHAQSNGAATAGGPTGGSPAADARAPQVVSNGVVSVAVRPHVVLGRTMLFRGTLPKADAGRTVAIERLLPDSGWTQQTTTTVRSDGSFLARWKTKNIGRFRMRATLTSPDASRTAQASSTSPELPVVVYRPSEATWYGPGFYGNKTACGVKLTKSLHGVAHKTLPCGTQVALLYKGRSITVPVVDRGPYRPGTDWDLTSATAEAIGFEYTDTIGAVRLRDVPPVQLKTARRR